MSEKRKKYDRDHSYCKYNLGKYIEKKPRVTVNCLNCNDKIEMRVIEKRKFCCIECRDKYYLENGSSTKGIERTNFWWKDKLGIKKGYKQSEEHIKNRNKSRKKNNPDWWKNKKEIVLKNATKQREYWDIGKYNKETSIRVFKEYMEKYGNPMFNPEYLKKALTNRKFEFPNKSEKKLLNIMIKNNLDYKYVGDGSVIIGHKNPDYINTNGKKILIEHFGDYWHQNDTGEERIKNFEKYGFKTLIIWEHELKEPTTVVNKIKNFEL